MAEPNILLADDDAAIRTVISRALTRQGYRIQATGTAATLWRWIEDGTGDVAILDVVLPDENALDLLPRIKHRRPTLPIIMMSAQNTLLTAVRATERGAFDYLPKPFDLTNLLTMVKRALALPRAPVIGPAEPGRFEEQLPIIGRSQPMQEIYRAIARLMGIDLTIMINGESGTGKELVARAMHDYGKRRGGPFIAVNMAAIPRELIESELFGHEKGSFTGANARKVGRFEQAEGGTLFLDEIGDMPLEAQTRLLRVLQSGEFMPVGGRTPIKANLQDHRRHPSRPAPPGRARRCSARICSTASTWCRCGCRRCASAPRTSRRWCSISSSGRAARACRSRPSSPMPWRG